MKVAKCGSSNRVIAAVKRFSKEFEKDLKENTASEPLHLEMQLSFTNFGNSNSYLAKITSFAIDYWAGAIKIRTMKLILTTLSSFPQKFPPTKITHCTICVVKV